MGKKIIGNLTELLIESGEVVENLSLGWRNICDKAYRGCEGAEDKNVFQKYCVDNNCEKCPYNN